MAVAATADAAATTVGAAATPLQNITSGKGWVSPTLADWVKPVAAETPSFTGRAWYVDQTNGDDANPGTAQAPWRSLAPTSGLRMASGDALLLKCGDIYRDTLDLTTEQAPEGNILIGAWGDCSGDRRPIIRASDWVLPSGWTREPNGLPIYTKTYAKPLKRLFLDGTPLIKARYPNFRSVGAEFAISVANASNSVNWNTFTVAATDRAALAGKDVVGATVHLKVTQWGTVPSLIKTYDPVTGLITLDRTMPFAIQPGSGYILEGKPWMLDSAGEWSHDETTGQLRLWTRTGGTPALMGNLEASWRTFGVVAHWIPNLRVERIAVEQQDGDGFELLETPNVAVSDVKATHVQEIGISVLDASGVVIEDSLVVGAGRSGIVSRETPGARVLRNRVLDTGGFGRAGPTDAAIALYGENGLAENNVIERAAYLGIRFANRAGTVVRGNAAYNFCLRFSDCAGVYSYTGGAAASMPSTYVAMALVDSNTLAGARSNPEGCGYSCANLSNGIYLDELSRGVTITRNTVSDTEIGIGLLNSSHNRVTSNRIFGSSAAGIRATKSRGEVQVGRGNQVVGNTILVHRPMSSDATGVPAIPESPVAMYWFHYADGAQWFAAGNGTVVSDNQVLSVNAAGDARWIMANWSTRRVLTPTDWRPYAPTDRQVNRITYKPYIATTDPSVIANGGFDPGLGGWRPYFSPAGSGGSFTMTRPTSAGYVGTLVAGSTSDYLESTPFSLSGVAGRNLYLLKYTATGGTGGGMRRALVRRSVSPWDNLGLSLPAVSLAAGQSMTSEVFFLAGAANNNAVLDLRSAVRGQTVLSNVSLSRVRSIEFMDPKRLVSFAVNPTTDPVSFNCASLALSSCDIIDETGAAVTFPMVVAARSARTLFAREARWLP